MTTTATCRIHKVTEHSIVTDQRVPVVFKNEHHETLETPDGVRMPVRYWPGMPGRGAVVFVHGLMSHAGWFSPTGSWFNAEHGFTCLALDRRGSGRSQAARGHMRNYRHLALEIDTALNWLHDRHPGAPIHLAGQCYGSLPVLVYALEHQERLRTLTLMSPAINTHKTLSLPQRLRVLALAFLKPQHRLPVPLEPKDFTDIPDNLDFIENDRLLLREATVQFYLQTALMTRNVARAARLIKVPTLMALAELDCVCDNAAARRYFEQLGASDKRVLDYGASMHSLEYGSRRADFLRDWLDWMNAHENGFSV